MKTVLITGAAGGIGRAAAILFQQKGYKVAATMRDPEKEIKLKNFKNITCYRMDVTEEASVAHCIREVINDFGSLDILVNNAGLYTIKPLETMNEDEFNRIINTNVAGTIRVMKAVIPHFRQKRTGTIINLSSVAGRIAFPYQTVYQSTKWAIEGLSEGMVYELKNLGISVKIVEPGMIRTHLYDEVRKISLKEYPREYMNNFCSWHEYLMRKYRKGYDARTTAKTIYRAATDRRNKLRYTTGLDIKAALILRAILPFSLFRRIISRMTGV